MPTSTLLRNNGAAYQADYFEKLEIAIRWATEQGYTPALLDECIFK